MTKLAYVRCAPLLLAALALSACEEDFARFNEIEGLRILGIRADQPTLLPGDQTTLDVLLYLEKGDPAAVEYSWSLCPFLNPEDERECWTDEAGFADALGIDPALLDFDLGNDTTATFEYSPDLVPLLTALCDTGADVEDDLGGLLFSCQGGFPMYIMLRVTHGDNAPRTSYKRVRLALTEDAPLNHNPRLADQVLAVRRGGALAPTRENATPLPEALALGASYELFVQVEEGAETFTDQSGEEPETRPERVYITWHISSGETEYARTSLVEDADDPPPLEENEWTLPHPADENANEAQLFIVLRDERGGIDWIQRQVELTR